MATLETAFPKLAWAYVNRLRVHPTKLMRAIDGAFPETATEAHRVLDGGSCAQSGVSQANRKLSFPRKNCCD